MKLIAVMRAAKLAAGLGSVFLGTVVVAQTKIDARVDLHFKDADIYAATYALTVDTGIKFVFADPSMEYGLITLSIDGVDPESALRYICEAAGATWSVDQNGVYVIRHRDSTKSQQEPIASPISVKIPLIVKKIAIMKADPRHVYEVIVTPDRISFGDSIQEIAKGVSTVESAKITAPPLTFITNGSAVQNTFNPKTGPALVEDKIELPQANAGQGGGAGGLGVGGGGGGFGGGQGGGGGGGLGGGGQGGQLGAAQGTILAGGTGLVPNGITSVVWDPTDNSFIVQGTEEAILELEKLIAQFDNAPKQVIVKVEFVTTSSSVDKSFGIDWVYQRGNIFAGITPGSFARSGDPVFLNYATGNISTRLRALLQEGWGRTVNAPLLRTLNNQPASVTNSVSTTIFVNQIVQGPSGNIIVPNPVSITANTNLSITPRINGDDTITMFIGQQLQGFGQFKRTPIGDVPDIFTQTIQAIARVKNGETIALGGMTNKVDNYSIAKIPILSDLPIIGQLFRGRSAVQTGSELIIFVTPTIIEEDVYGLGP